MLSQFAEPEYALALLEHGSERRAYLLKERVYDRHGSSPRSATSRRAARAFDPTVVEALVSARAGARSPLARADAARARGARRGRAGQEQRRDRGVAVLTKRAVEKHINSIFAKLGLRGAQDVSQRVKAALMFLDG